MIFPGKWFLRAVLFALFSVCVPALAAERNLEIYIVDVLGGAATLIVTPEGESILIDSGWPGLEDRDPKRIESVLKEVAGVSQLDHLVTTHWHIDHFGGVEGLAKRLKIGQFWDRGIPDLSASDQDSANYPDGPKANDPLGVAYRKASEGRRKALKAGDVLPLKGKVELLTLASGGKVIEGSGKPNPLCATLPPDLPIDRSDNARSLAFRIKLGAFELLDCGDLTWNVEKDLVCPTNRIGQIDLYLSTHHGSAISNHPTLIQSIAPIVTIIGNGPRKGADPETFQRLKGIPSLTAIYQLHKNARTGPADNVDPAFIANTSETGGTFIKVSVPPDGRSFDVQMGANGKPTRYQSVE